MLHYPKIPGSRDAPLAHCVAFEKYDGTNLHWDWDRDLGWHSFGTRRDAFDLDTSGIKAFVREHSHLRESADLFLATLAKLIEPLFRTHPEYQDYQSFKVFTEFLGPNSFAGLHVDRDPKELRLFDVWVEPWGFLGPVQFVRDFGDFSSARMVYRGRFTGKFAEDVRQGKYGVKEGVVCKGGTDGSDLWMAKIKTNAYLQRLQEAFADRWAEFWE